MTALIADLRFAVRVLLARPAHTLAVVLTLALAIGATAAIYSVVDAVLLRALPYADADRIVALWATHGDDRRVLADYADIMAWREQSDSLEVLGVVRDQSVNLTGNGAPDRIAGEFVDADALTVLGAQASRGRVFTREESAPGSGSDVAVLADDTWKNRFGADPDIIGRTLELNGRPRVVIGVLAPDFVSPFGQFDVWLPISAIPTPQTFERGNPNVWAVARLKEGRAPRAAQVELSGIAERLATLHPATNAGVGIAVVPLREQVAGSVRPALLTMLAAVIVVLLIACANVAGLQLARGAARQHEIALRTALGARRGRIVRQLLVENLIVCLAAGACGVALAMLATHAFSAFAQETLPTFGPIEVDARVITFSLAVTAIAALACGLSPAWFASRMALHGTLGVRSVEALRGGRTRRAIVVAELALAVVLLVSAGLLGRSIERLEHEDTGFAPEHLLTFQFRLPAVKYATSAAQTEFLERALEQVRAVPGVTRAALVGATPFTGNWDQSAYEIAGRAPPGGALPITQTNTISNGYFATMQIALLRGRDFDERDRADAARVAIVNAEFAQREWPDGSALGQRLRIAGTDGWLVVAGVVGNVKQLALGDPPTAQVYLPIQQSPDLFSNVVARTAGDALAAAPAVRAAIWAVDADQPMWSVHSMDELLARSTARLRLTTALGSAFALAGLLLALIGIYGVVSFMVAQRTRELGTRIAVGATRSRVIMLVLRDGLRLTLVAIAVGSVAALAAARLLASQLFGVGAFDLPTYAGTALLLGAVALLACWLPARRAADIDPIEALRHE